MTVLIALVGAGAVVGCARRPAVAPWITFAAAALTVCTAAAAAKTRAVFDVAWIPSWGARITLEADALGSLLALLATGIGVLVVAYSRSYIVHHLRAGGRSEREQIPYYAWTLLFLASMVGLAYARDLILLFLFFDLTAVCSYFLIAFDRDDADARRAALMAIIVTGAGSMALLVATVIWAADANSFDATVVRTSAIPGAARESAALLLVVAALVKSAQVPFHFWLPRAMAAPTPISAYLHSAAMVAAGVFLLMRLEPLLSGTRALAVLPYLGLASIAVGSALALSADALKQLLAYSTISQYGHVLLLIGLSGDAGRAGAPLYLMAHAIAKSALFLTAGVVTHVTGEDRLSKLGGLRGRIPVLAVTSGAAAAALAGLPLTIGYFKDEVLFEAALDRGSLFAGAAVVAVGLTLAYMTRFWFGMFGGRDAKVAHSQAAHAPVWLVAPVAVLAVVAVIGGLAPGVLSRVAMAAGSASAGEPVRLALKYQPGPPLLLALSAYATGVLVYVGSPWWRPALLGIRTVGERVGPEVIYHRSFAALDRFSDRLHNAEVRDLRDRIAAIMLPALVLVAVASISLIDRAEWQIGSIELTHTPLLIGLAALAVAGVSTPGCRTHLGLVVALSAAGFTLSAVYALLGAPDLAIVSVLVATATTLLLLAAFGALPLELLQREDVIEGRANVQKRRHRLTGVAAGVIAFVVAWSSLSTRPTGGVAEVYAEWSGRVHAEDPVSAILADFRGLDTAGETTVLAVALLGLFMLLGEVTRRHTRRSGPGPKSTATGGVSGTPPIRLVVPVILVASWAVALALLLKGHAETGDGFSAGLTVGTGILIFAIVGGRERAAQLLLVRRASLLARIGLLMVLAPVVVPVLLGDPPFQHYPPAGNEALSIGVLVLQSGFIIDLGVFALVLGFLASVVDLFARGTGAAPRETE